MYIAEEVCNGLEHELWRLTDLSRNSNKFNVLMDKAEISAEITQRVTSRIAGSTTQHRVDMEHLTLASGYYCYSYSQ